jgi:PTS system galactitol-specific IIC component
MGGVFFLLTRMISILVEGLLPIAEQAKVYLRERYKGRELYIGLDSALLIGQPSVMAVALIMMPVSILLAVILPGNKFLPFADLVFYPFVFAIIVAMLKGNILKSIIVSIPIDIIFLYTSTYMAKFYTPAGLATGMPALQSGQMASSVLDAGFPVPLILTWFFAEIVNPAFSEGKFLPLVITLVVLAAVIYGAILLSRRARKPATA